MNLHIHAMQLPVLLLTIHFAKLASTVFLHMNRNSPVSTDEEIASQRGRMIFPQSLKVRNRLQEHLICLPGLNNQMAVPWDEENRQLFQQQVIIAPPQGRL